ncbi:hypothetical protein XM47_15235 [Catenovulum maritimum]|uniref:Uncharacterized protein n=2 Tax=Catenovulum maritimum TaxID=1513271 RepID=A0A0J8JIE7_9ALTE|nr:hypothetical protein XM47_15235 [Catenovulum maritimum]
MVRQLTMVLVMTRQFISLSLILLPIIMGLGYFLPKQNIEQKPPADQFNSSIKQAKLDIEPVKSFSLETNSSLNSDISLTQSKTRINSTQQIYEFISKNPAKAAQFISENEVAEQFAFSMSLINNWSLKEPQLALTWLQSQSNKFSKVQYEMLMRGLLKNYAKVQPDYVFYQLEYLAPEAIWHELMFDIAQAWVNQNPDEAVRWLDDLANSKQPIEYLTGAHVVVLETYAKLDMVAARNWLNKLPNKALRQQIENQLDL